ncbi:hypothetical protein FA95DRAFT_1613161 [Auriscalpium vulgare]|uniref:Uncharacterized protein n=1 Tax=Auriscalpium vulgare TaxID=40419 RepID=A0ACB8R4I5_9AGAM|nr:hypothetical protein FA95DRAFT_1613161 [Auriscalpium vulgare]
MPSESSRAIDVDLEDIELERSIHPDDDISELIATISLADLPMSTEEARGPAQRNRHNYRVREAGGVSVVGPWYEAAARTQGVPGTAVKAFKSAARTSKAAEGISGQPLRAVVVILVN